MRNTSIRVVASVIASLCLAASVQAAEKAHKAVKGEKPHWAYAGKTGPEKWGALEKDFEQCKLGQTQSPIDIPDANARKGDIAPLLFAYKPTPARIIDNGHTIQVNVDPGNTVSVADKKYELLQFHFHKPSEEKINGRAHDMVAHLVHKDGAGKLGVVAVLIDAGKPTPVMATVIDQLPKEKEKEVPLTAAINVADLLPDDKGYYTFAGSLTTPPCSESVTWYVLKTPKQVASDNIARFGKVYPMNARPVQPLNNRDIMATLR